MRFMQTESVLQTKNRSGPAKNRFSVALVTSVDKCITRAVRKLLRQLPFFLNDRTSFKTTYIVIKCYIYGFLG